MEIELFTLSDSAEVYNGKLVIVGTFDSIPAPTIPYRHPAFAVVVSLRFGEQELGEHKIVLRMVDSAGNQILAMQGNVNVQSPQMGLSYSRFSEVFKFGNVQFNNIGRYTYELYVDEEWRSAIPLNIFQMIQPPRIKAA